VKNILKFKRYFLRKLVFTFRKIALSTTFNYIVDLCCLDIHLLFYWTRCVFIIKQVRPITMAWRFLWRAERKTAYIWANSPRTTHWLMEASTKHLYLYNNRMNITRHSVLCLVKMYGPVIYYRQNIINYYNGANFHKVWVLISIIHINKG